MYNQVWWREDPEYAEGNVEESIRAIGEVREYKRRQ